MTATTATTNEDEIAVATELDRFVRRAIEPRVARPEAPMDATALRALLDEAEALGLAGDDETPSGLGPWEELAEGRPPARTLRTLVRLARACPAVAFAIHQRALSRATVRALGLPRVSGPLAIAPQGWLGLGRVALARALAQSPLDDDDRAILSDLYAPGATRILPLEPAFSGLLVPTFGEDGFAWQLHSADALVLEIDPDAHGLDELRTTRVRPSAAPLATVAVGVEALAVTMAAHQLALVAIALGAVEHAHALARAFAAQRRQGGATIDHHAAVLALLGKSRGSIGTARAHLEALGAGPLSRTGFADVLACRAEAMPALADAAHGSMQTFGGLGYMRDTGVEKAARDVNVLRAIAGAPTELPLIVAEWERIHD